jgi:hypothetical protein
MNPIPTSTSASSTGQRHNAIRHGLLADGITPLDDAGEFMNLLGDLEDKYQPDGPVESFLLQRMALCMTRLNRAALLEADYIASRIDTRNQADPTGNRPRMATYQVENLNKTYHRYETAIQNKLFQTLKQFNDLRRTEFEGFGNVEGSAQSRPRRCRRRPVRTGQDASQEALRNTPHQNVESQPDPTKTPLHY